MSDTIAEMASLLRICALTLRDISGALSEADKTSILGAAARTDHAARLLERCRGQPIRRRRDGGVPRPISDTRH